MKLVCSQSELNNALQLVSRAVSSRPTHPILANVLLTADEGTSKLSLTGYDLNLGIQTGIKASIENSGAITLPARLLVEIISKLNSDSPITLKTLDDNDEVEINSLNSTYKMRGISSDDFPELPVIESRSSLQVSPSSLTNALRSTLFSSSSDDAKQLLTGVHISFEAHHMEAASTDGHRLSVSKEEEVLKEGSVLPSELISEDGKFSVTLPAKSLREVERLLMSWNQDETLSIFCDKGQVVFSGKNQILTTRTLEGNYPNYNQLIPDEFSKNIQINRKLFISALERVAVLADQHNNVVKINSSDNSINISADAQDVGSGIESIPVVQNGDSLQVAFNVRYILEGLKAINSDLITLQCNSPTTPAVIIPNDHNGKFLYLIMPVQIRS